MPNAGATDQALKKAANGDSEFGHRHIRARPSVDEYIQVPWKWNMTDRKWYSSCSFLL
jgi:hypothetical protein